LCLQEILGLLLDNAHLPAKLDLASIKVHEDVDVESVDDLVGLTEELSVLQRVSRTGLALPLSDVDVSFEQVFVP